MSSTALRAVRELRGDDSRPSTSAGGRPGTSSGMRAGSPEDAFPSAAAAAASSAALAAAQAEALELRAQLEKERRNSRALEQYLAEANEAKDTELREAAAEVKQALASLQRAEAHAASLEGVYKGQVSKLSLTVERLQTKPPTPREAEESFSEVLRDEMRTMQAAYTLKLDHASAELASRTLESTKQIRSLNEALTEERRKNASILEKMSRASATAPPTPTAASASASAARPNSGANAASTSSLSSSAAASRSTATATSATTPTAKLGTTTTTKPVVKK